MNASKIPSPAHEPRYMGIDYGTKRIGIAISDESNRVAMPRVTLVNSPKIYSEIAEFVSQNAITHIVIGESKDFQGKDNKVMERIRPFADELRNLFTLDVIFEPEFMTSEQAERFQGKIKLLDASAAAIILQSYLDRGDTIVKRPNTKKVEKK